VLADVAVIVQVIGPGVRGLEIGELQVGGMRAERLEHGLVPVVVLESAGAGSSYFARKMICSPGADLGVRVSGTT
jgi:hypothetical protein